jgi:hypothetical protein
MNSFLFASLIHALPDPLRIPIILVYYEGRRSDGRAEEPSSTQLMYEMLLLRIRSATTSHFLVPQQRNIIDRGFFAHVTSINMIKSCADYFINNRIR